MRPLQAYVLPIAMLAAAILAGSAACAADVKISDAWMRALPSNLPAGGYFTLHNGGKKALTLTGASSSACGMLMLHKSENMGGMMHMEDVTKVDVPAGGTLSFAPGGYHLMCMQPTSAIKPGNTVQVSLIFADGSRIEAPFAVRTASGQ